MDGDHDISGTTALPENDSGSAVYPPRNDVEGATPDFIENFADIDADDTQITQHYAAKEPDRDHQA